MSKDKNVEETVKDEEEMDGSNPAAATQEEIDAKKGVPDDELDSLFESHASGEEVEWDSEDDDDEPEKEPSKKSDNKSESDEGEEKDQTVEKEPSQEDQEKERQAVEAIGNKNYIDKDLINSIEDKELRQKVWKLANDAQSNYNRLYPREQEINRLRSEVENLKRRQDERPDPATRAEKDKQDKEAQAEIDRLKRDYPDLAKSIDALANTTIEKKSQELTELFDQKYGPMLQRDQEQSRQQELQQLEQTANQIFDTEKTGVSYRDVVASPDFSAWLSAQPKSIQALADSDTAAETARVLQMFDTDYSRMYRDQYGSDWREDVAKYAGQAEETSPSANSQNDASAPNRSEESNKADELAAKRQETKRKSTVGLKPTRSAANSDTSLDDPDSLFDHYAKQSTRNKR